MAMEPGGKGVRAPQFLLSLFIEMQFKRVLISYCAPQLWRASCIPAEKVTTSVGVSPVDPQDEKMMKNQQRPAQEYSYLTV